MRLMPLWIAISGGGAEREADYPLIWETDKGKFRGGYYALTMKNQKRFCCDVTKIP